MKKTVLSLFILFITQFSFAQSIDVSPFFGWQMNGKVRLYQGDINTKDEPVFGGTIDFNVSESFAIRMMYSRTETRSYFTPFLGFGGLFPPTNFKLINEYYQIGTVKSIPMGSFEPYVLLTLGAARFNGRYQDVSANKWYFAINAGAGFKYFFNETIGLKIEGAFMVPMYFEGVGFYFGTGGSGLSVNNRVPLLQGNFNGGLVFRLNK